MSGQPGGAPRRRRVFRPGVEHAEPRLLLSTFIVRNTADSGPGSLREAITQSNQNPGPDFIEFDIPASSSGSNSSVPVDGFDPITQTWRIELESPLPVLTDQVTIDGLSQAETGKPFRYPEDNEEPTVIFSKPNETAALEGNDAELRLIIDGSGIDRGRYPEPTGFVLDTSHSNLRGMIIDGFAVGVEVPGRDNVGNRIQGNSIGGYFVYPVDPQTGDPLPAPNNVAFAGVGLDGDGVIIRATNTTLGGFNAQENNTITLAGGRGVWIPPGAEGNQLFGNQIGVIGPSSNGVYVQAGNGAEGVRIESSTGPDGETPELLSSSHVVGGASSGAGNVISANASHGIRIVGPGALRNRVEGNYIGAAPGGGYRFGAGNPGNLGDGVFLDNAPSNRIGAEAGNRQNVISANSGVGVRIAGASASGNAVSGNLIGLTSDGLAALGNALEGVRLERAATGNTVGNGNVISGNLRGVLIEGAQTTGNILSDNLIGSASDGVGDLGNAFEGVRIENSPGNRIIGDGQGSQLLSGNNVGLAIVGPGASGNVASGNFVGTDISGTIELNNSLQGVLIENASGSLIGGTTEEQRNLISANHWGVEISGPEATGNTVSGNLIGTDGSGEQPLGNEVDGVRIRQGASRNLIGGRSTEAGNLIAFNRRDGVRVEENSIEDAILTNSIFENSGLGIHLVDDGSRPGPNRLRPAPELTLVRSSTDFSNIEGTLRSVPLTTFTLQFFSNPALDPSGWGEGARFLGETSVSTGADGFAAFSADVPGDVPPGEFVTATATDSNGNTSAFSAGVAEVLGTVQFVMAEYVVDESAGQAIITVTRTGGSGGQATVRYETSGGSATPGRDYDPVSGTLTFDIGVDSRTFRVPILDDDTAEAEETVGLVLRDPAGAATLGTPSFAVLRITDDDQSGLINFSMSSYVVDEGLGVVATIGVVRSAAGGTVTISYETRAGDAIPGVDYTPVSGTLTFEPGQTEQFFTVPILFNPASTGSRVLGLFLENPTGGARLGTPDSAILTIENVEVPRVTSVSTVANRRGILQITLGFNVPMDQPRTENLLNYGYSVQVPGHQRHIGTREDLLVPLAPARYDPATQSVTLTTLRGIRPRTPVLVRVNQVTDTPSVPVGVASDQGILLDGDGDGLPGGAFSTVVQVPRPTVSVRPLSALPLRRLALLRAAHQS